MPRLLAKLMGEPDGLRPRRIDWADTAVACPTLRNGRDLRAVLTGRRLTASGGEEQRWLPVEDLFAEIPAAVLVATASG